MAEGALVWLFPDGYIPSRGRGKLLGHEALCILNTNEVEAEVLLDIYFEDRDPIEGVGPIKVPPKRTKHIRLDRVDEVGVEIPRETPYAIRVRSNVKIVAQLSRMDVTQPNLALMTTMGFPI